MAMKASGFCNEHSHKLRSSLCTLLDLSLWDKITQKAEYVAAKCRYAQW